MHRQKNDLFLARLPGILENSNENYRRYNFQAFANILSHRGTDYNGETY